MHHYIIPLLRKEPANVIIHCGTNDALYNSGEEIVGELMQLKMFIEANLPNSNVIISFPTMRNDKYFASAKASKLRVLLNDLRCESISHFNIASDCLESFI